MYATSLREHFFAIAIFLRVVIHSCDLVVNASMQCNAEWCARVRVNFPSFFIFWGGPGVPLAPFGGALGQRFRFLTNFDRI